MAFGPSAQYVGNMFVQHYYSVLHKSPRELPCFYSQNSSTVGRLGTDGYMLEVTLQQAIDHNVLAVGYGVKAEIKSIDAQYSIGNTVIVSVRGYHVSLGGVKRRFSQTFLLYPQIIGHYVRNDMFRYEDTDDDNQQIDHSLADVTLCDKKETASPEKPYINIQEDQYIKEQKQEYHLEEEEQHVKEQPVKKQYVPKQQPRFLKDVNEASKAAVSVQRKEANKAAVSAPSDNGVRSTAKVQAQVSPEVEVIKPVLTAHSKSMAEPIARATVAEMSPPSSVQGDAQMKEMRPVLTSPLNPVTEPIPPATHVESCRVSTVPRDAEEKTFVSIVKGLRENPAPFVVPTRTQPSSSKLPSPSNNPSARFPAPSKPMNPAMSSKVGMRNYRQEVDAHSIFVRNLPFNCTAKQLEEEFNRFGRVRGIDIKCNQEQGRCFAFLEFEDRSSIDIAIEASPMEMGDRTIYIEEKRQKESQVGEVRGPGSVSWRSHGKESFNRGGSSKGNPSYPKVYTGVGHSSRSDARG